MAASVNETFTAFFEKWLVQQQALLEKLQTLSASSSSTCIGLNDECRAMAAEAIAHYKTYYDEKLKATKENAFIMFSPPWLSSFERALLWVTGFKPLMALSIVKNSVGELSDEQTEKFELLKRETRKAEREIDQAIAKVQESVAVPPIVDMMRKMGKFVDFDEGTGMDQTMENVKESMIVMMENADNLRGSTVVKVMEILDPLQSVKFLAAAAQFHFQARKWGLEKDARAESTSA